MTEFDKKLNLWVIDDLAKRRDFHEKIIIENEPNLNVFKIAHPLHLKRRLELEKESLKNSYNIFLSDYNMKWFNVEWSEDLIDIDNLKANPSYDNFPGTQKVLNEYKELIDSFLLVMLSTVVNEDSYSANTGFSHIETNDEAWIYDELNLNKTGINSIHKLAKPFNKKKLNQVFRHYKYLINHLSNS
jgi:hypothetical protein